MSVIQGDFPDTLKIEKVIPIYKGDDEQMVQNYRPISILPFFSKIYEFFFFNHIINFLTINDIEGLELKRNISTFFQKMGAMRFPSVKQPYFACKKPLHPISS